MPQAAARLKKKDADGAEYSEQGADLKLPLAQNLAFFWKHDEREQSGDDDGEASEDGIDAGADVFEREHLGDLMDDVRHSGQEAKSEGAAIEARSAAFEAKNDEGSDGETGDAVTVKILRPDIVMVLEKKILEKRRQRPDDDGGEDREVAARKAKRRAGARHRKFLWDFARLTKWVGQ